MLVRKATDDLGLMSRHTEDIAAEKAKSTKYNFF